MKNNKLFEGVLLIIITLIIILPIIVNKVF